MNKALAFLSSRWGLFILFIIALAIRLIAVDMLSAPPEKDALQYHQIALHLVSGAGFSLDGLEPTTLRPPLYPLFIAAVYALFGVEYHHVLMVQAVIHAALVFPVFWLALRISGSAVVGWIAAGLFSVLTSFEIVTRLYAENMLILLMLAFVIVIYRMLSHVTHRGRYAVAAGVLAGLMGLTKPEFAMLGMATFLFALLWRSTRTYWRLWLMLSIVSLLVVGGWQMRSFNVPPSGQSFANETLIFSNCPALLGDGLWAVTDMARLEQQRERCHRELDALPREQLVAKVRQIWLDDPLMMIKLIVNRVLILWVSPPVGSSALAALSPLVVWVALLGQYLIVALALAAMLTGFSGRKEMFPFLLVVVYMTVIYGLLHSIRRYGYPFAPELCIMFSCGLLMLYDKWKKRKGE